ncbi:hypothetical protein J6590_028105 [Homalodisca vitripennis]|nr:hypothetical protein J6590_028105 [Homalodisca vitripennis]
MGEFKERQPKNSVNSCGSRCAGRKEERRRRTTVGGGRAREREECRLGTRQGSGPVVKSARCRHYVTGTGSGSGSGVATIVLWWIVEVDDVVVLLDVEEYGIPKENR